MRANTWVKALMTVAVLCLAGWGANARQQTGDPVADAARKARAEKKNETKPKKVYTDDDVRGAAPAATSSTASSGGKPAGDATANRKGAPDTADAEEKEDPNGEKAWRTRFQEQREKIAKTERQIDVLQRELDKAQTEYYPDPQKAMDQQNTRKDIIDKQAKITAKQAELEQLKQELSSMEDQLRKSGGDPGWAR
jgi:chromosome segregation ATPase